MIVTNTETYKKSFVSRSPQTEIYTCLLGLLLSVLVIILTIYIVVNTRANAINAARDATISSSLIFTAQAAGALTEADAIGKNLTDFIRDADFKSEDDFREKMSDIATFERLRQTSFSQSQVAVITIIDNNGSILNFNRWWPAISQENNPINVSDREFFVHFQENPHLDSYVSLPIENRSNRETAFYITRKIVDKFGKKLGLVNVGIDVVYFKKFYESVTINGDNRIIKIENLDGKLVSSYPMFNDFWAKRTEFEPAFRQIMADAGRGAATLIDTPAVGMPAGSRLHITSGHIIPNFPLILTVTNFDVDFLAHWQADAQTTAAGGAAIVVLIAVLTWGVARFQSRYRKYLAVIRESERQVKHEAQMKSEFMARMSHEIRSPINAVIGLSEALLKAGLPPEGSQKVKIINEAGNHLFAIISDILNKAEIESGQVKIIKSPVAIKEFVETVVNMAKNFPHAADLNLTTEFNGSVPNQIKADIVRIRQILINLIANSVKFTNAGGITVRVKNVSGVCPDTQNVRLRFEVADTGSGMSQDLQNRLFTPFVRSTDEAAHTKEGTGLGLSICRDLVTLMGGEIGVQSQLGQGSVFWFELPFLALPDAPAPRVASPAVPDRRCLRVLLVDDSMTNQMVGRMQLEAMGHKVVIADNGSSALRIIQEQAIDLVLMDMKMPVMNGPEATRNIRALGGHFARMPIIALSSDELDDSRETATAAGMTGYATKPIRPETLGGAIHQAMALSALH